MVIDQSLGFRIERVNVDITLVANDCVSRTVWVPQIPVKPDPSPDDKITDEFDLCEITRAVMLDETDEGIAISETSLVSEAKVLEYDHLNWAIKLK